jgi:hypothetical protein
METRQRPRVEPKIKKRRIYYENPPTMEEILNTSFYIQDEYFQSNGYKYYPNYLLPKKDVNNIEYLEAMAKLYMKPGSVCTKSGIFFMDPKYK